MVRFDIRAIAWGSVKEKRVRGVLRGEVPTGRWRAVIFDLWDTLVAFPWQVIADRDAALAKVLSVDPGELSSAWMRLEPTWETGPLRPSLGLLCTELGLRDSDLEQLMALRVEYMRQALRPPRKVIETLRELRKRGLRLGLISGCSGDVPIVWGETPFFGLFDTAVFSCEARMRKPDVQIYHRAASELRIPASSCLYVGDGARDELAGAVRAGMTAVLLQTSLSARQESGEWTHEIDDISAVLSLV